MGKRPFYRKVRQTLHETVSDSGKSILCYRGNNDKIYYVASSNDPNVEPGGGMIEVTWLELKDKRDAGKLTPGSLYRITDYQCTTTQENTKSAGHQFDIVLLALSEDKLAEEGWAMHHIDDTYFANSNLSAWKIWYCLDNDKSRFAWADDSVIGDIENIVVYYPERTGLGRTVPAHDAVYTLTNETQIVNGVTYFKLIKLEGVHTSDMVELLVDTKNINTETTLYEFEPRSGKAQASPWNISIKSINYNTPPTEEGRGVIYRLIDEFNNDIKYDFKNIQFKRTIIDGQYDAKSDETWCYTLNVWHEDMCQDASIVGNTLLNDEGYITGVYDNKFGYATAHNLFIEGINTFSFALGGNVILSFLDDGYYYGIRSNTIGDSFYFNTIGSNFYSNTIGSGFCYNTILNDFNSNIMGNDFSANKIGNAFYHNNIRNSCNSNVIGNEVHDNTIGNYFNGRTISDNTFNKNYGNNGVELATKDDLN